VFSHQKPVHISPFYHRRYVPHPFRPPLVCYPNNIWWKVQITKLLIIKILSSVLLPPVTWVQLFSWAPCSWTPSMFCPQCEKTSIKPTQHKRQNHSFFILCYLCVIAKDSQLNSSKHSKIYLPLIKVMMPALNRIWSCDFVTTAKNFWFPLTTQITSNN